jgi:hypothetical protein
MSQPARKPSDPAGGKRGGSSPVDDPSIPVLTERLTLPPLDLDLEFRLPARPAAGEQNPVAPVADAPLEVPAPDVAGTQEAAEEAPDVPSAAQDERDATWIGMPAPVERPESDDTPRVPTSLLVSNVEALLPTPAGTTPYREAEEFDITRTGGAPPDQMETDLREMILLEVARRLPMEVETIVRRHLDSAIEEAIRRFAAEARIALAGSLREIVDRAVRAELEHINAQRNRET